MLHKHLFKKYFVPSVLFLLGAVLGIYILFTLDRTFRINKIDIQGVSQEEKNNLIRVLHGISSFSLQKSEIKKIISSRYPTMTVRESTLYYPNSLILVIEKEKPTAYLKTDKGYIALSKSGLVVLKERTEIIPSPSIIFYQPISHSEYQMGQYIGFMAVNRALIFISLLEDAGYQTETVAIDSVDMIACKTKGFEVVFSQTRSVDLQTNEVKQIIRQIKAGALRADRLDLRFEKPVVQLPKK